MTDILFPHDIKDRILQVVDFVLLKVEIGTRIPVLALLRVIVRYPTIGVVKRALKTLAGTVFRVVLENDVRHKDLSTVIEALYRYLGLLSNYHFPTGQRAAVSIVLTFMKQPHFVQLSVGLNIYSHCLQMDIRASETSSETRVPAIVFLILSNTLIIQEPKTISPAIARIPDRL